MEEAAGNGHLEHSRLKFAGMSPAMYNNYDDLFDPNTTSTMWKDRIDTTAASTGATVIAVRGPNTPYQAVENHNFNNNYF